MTILQNYTTKTTYLNKINNDIELVIQCKCVENSKSNFHYYMVRFIT